MHHERVSSEGENLHGEGEHPRLLRDREWTEPSGARWRMRGGELTPKQARRLLHRAGIRVLLVAGPEPVVVEGNDLDLLCDRLQEFWSGRSQPMADFSVGDFRNTDHDVLVVIQESC